MSKASTERFSRRVDDYVRYRPRYPPELLELLRREIGLRPGWRVADVGAGTGMSSELFLDHGNRVVAVEPNRAMLKAAMEELGGRPGFFGVCGTAEALPIGQESVDSVFVGQAFHWFDADRARGEFRRVLRPEGYVVVGWYTRKVDASPFMRAFEELLLRHGTDYGSVRHDRTARDSLADFYGGAPERRVLEHRQVLDREGLEGRLRSCSYAPLPDEEGHGAMIEDTRRIFEEYREEGAVRMLYDVEVYFGRVG